MNYAEAIVVGQEYPRAWVPNWRGTEEAGGESEGEDDSMTPEVPVSEERAQRPRPTATTKKAPAETEDAVMSDVSKGVADKGKGRAGDVGDVGVEDPGAPGHKRGFQESPSRGESIAKRIRTEPRVTVGASSNVRVDLGGVQVQEDDPVDLTMIPGLHGKVRESSLCSEDEGSWLL